MLKEKLNIDKFEDGKIIHKPFGVVFQGKNKKGKLTKFLFQVNNIEKYSSSHFLNILIRINNCKKNDNKDKAKIRKIIIWYMKIKRELLQAMKTIT